MRRRTARPRSRCARQTPSRCAGPTRPMAVPRARGSAARIAGRSARGCDRPCAVFRAPLESRQQRQASFELEATRHSGRVQAGDDAHSGMTRRKQQSVDALRLRPELGRALARQAELMRDQRRAHAARMRNSPSARSGGALSQVASARTVSVLVFHQVQNGLSPSMVVRLRRRRRCSGQPAARWVTERLSQNTMSCGCQRWR